MYKHIFFTLSVLFTGASAIAQQTFTHTTEAIDSAYFDSSLAPFYHGIASGDPLQDKVIIWTRITPAKDSVIPVKWFVAVDTAFTNIIKQGETTTDYTKDYTVKVDVSGLEPGNTYFYYFEALKANSLIGRTRTLPTNINHARLAVVSCANYQMGYFNAYQRLAERKDLDAIVHLGDYIYEYASFGYGWTSTVNRTHAPDHKLNSMDDYRIRHSYYKLDPNLRAAHQQHPFITIWDDHEIANNAYTTGVSSIGDHNPAVDGDYATRKFNAVRAYLEWMPIREQPVQTTDVRIYRNFNFGGLLDLYMVDTRLEERTQQVRTSTDPTINDTNRTILGITQRNWLFNNMNNSTAQWQVIGNQVMFSDLSQAFKLDSWSGYPYERELIKDKFINMNNKNIIILTGDTHRSWAFDLADEPLVGNSYAPNTGNGTFGLEFCTPSLASPNMDEGNSTMAAVQVEETVTKANNPHLRFIDLSRHGYFILDITPLKVQADYFYGPTKTPSNTESFGSGWFSFSQQGFLQEALAPAPAKAGNFIAAPANALAYTVGLSENIVPLNVLLVGAYPNPTKDKLTVGLTVNNAEKVDLRILTVEGKIVFKKHYNLQSGHHKIELSMLDLPKGVYLLEVLSNANQAFQKRIVKD